MEKFKELMAEILEVDEVDMDQELISFDCWDSLTILSIIAMLDESFGEKSTSEKISKCNTIGDIYKSFIVKE
jgi:acyl carrier protein